MAQSTTLVPFTRTDLDDSSTDRFQDNVEKVISPILSKEILDGRLLQGVSLTNGVTNKVPHGLTRAVNGYIITKKNANSNIWDLEASNTSKELFLNLTCSANVVINLWIF